MRKLQYLLEDGRVVDTLRETKGEKCKMICTDVEKESKYNAEWAKKAQAAILKKRTLNQ